MRPGGMPIRSRHVSYVGNISGTICLSVLSVLVVVDLRRSPYIGSADPEFGAGGRTDVIEVNHPS